MLSDEEKQAIKDLIDSNNLSLIGDGTCINSRHTIGTILNLIEKQYKEIEELKVNNKKLQDKAKELIYEKQQLTSALLDSTPNGKIKAKIEEVHYKMIGHQDLREAVKQALQSLLEKE